MANSRKRGDQHVLDVYENLFNKINQRPGTHAAKTVTTTVEYLLNLYPNIASVECKFQEENTNAAKDLTLVLDDGRTIGVNLFLIKQKAKIQTKNLGAKSFFKKYFLSEHLQQEFNRSFEKHYQAFLQGVVRRITHKTENWNNSKMKRVIAEEYPKFSSEIEIYRSKFLYNLREEAFRLLKDTYNEKDKGFEYAYHSLFMTEDETIITRYGKYESSVTVERFSPSTPYFNMIEIYKSGRNSVGIKYGETALTLRFKFESSPISSIKLATSYDTFPSEAENEAKNKATIRKMNKLIENHKHIGERNQSNAIGKCHEALTYYYFLVHYPDVLQVEQDECFNQMKKYYHIVRPEILQDLHHSTSTIIPAIREKIYEKYSDFEIESIELVPESYIDNRLDTGDIKLTLKVGQYYEVESISLKATAKKGNRLTTKNPGVGTILGPTYFNIGDLKPVTKMVREKYEKKVLSHRDCLEVLSKELGRQLASASQQNLKLGINHLLGEAMMAITFYKNNESVCKMHSEIDSTVLVFPQTPSEIQTRLTWNENEESIQLRVKFSRAHKHGWSSIKLTSEYLLK